MINSNQKEHKISIYSTENCLYCKALRHYLKSKKLLFKEFIVDKDKKALKKMLEESDGFTGVPFIVVEKKNCTKFKIKGFDVRKLNTALNI